MVWVPKALREAVRQTAQRHKDDELPEPIEQMASKKATDAGPVKQKQRPVGGCEGFVPVRRSSPWRCSGCALWIANVKSRTNSGGIKLSDRRICEGGETAKARHSVKKKDGSIVVVERPGLILPGDGGEA